MRKTTVTALTKPIFLAHSMLGQFIEACPDDLWTQTFGGWPVWQQVYHVYSAYDYFTLQKNGTPLSPLCPDNVAGLQTPGTRPLSKDQIKAFAEGAKKQAEAYIATLDDDALTAINEGFSSRRDMEFDNAATLVMLAGHTLYHLGTFDAGLRERGLQGIF